MQTAIYPQWVACPQCVGVCLGSSVQNTCIWISLGLDSTRLFLCPSHLWQFRFANSCYLRKTSRISLLRLVNRATRPYAVSDMSCRPSLHSIYCNRCKSQEYNYSSAQVQLETANCFGWLDSVKGGHPIHYFLSNSVAFFLARYGAECFD